MKREIKADKPIAIKAPGAPRSQERELSEAALYIVEQISQRFRTQVFGELHKSTVEKFADESIGLLDAPQRGNYAKVYLSLANKVRRKLLRQFDDKRIEQLVKKVLDKVNKRNRSELYGLVEKRIGLNSTELTQTEGLMADINALNLETAQWVKKLRDETLEVYTANSLRAMTQGSSLEEIMSQFDGLVEKRKNHAKFTARNQIANFNSITTKLRAQNLGITRARWITSRDERVRGKPGGKYPNAKPNHHWADGKGFDLDKGLKFPNGDTLLPGVDYQCFPGSAQLDHASFCQKLYRRWYTGELAELIFDDGTVLTATPNHPILTVGGFKAAHLLDETDQVVRAFDKRPDGIEFHGQNVVPTFEQIFRALELLGIEHGVSAPVPGEFHGDISDGEVDIITLDRLLVDGVNPSVREKFKKLNLPRADEMGILNALTCAGYGGPSAGAFTGTTASFMGSLDLVRSRFIAHLGPLELFGFALGAWCNPGAEKAISNNAATDAQFVCDSIFAFSVLVHGREILDRKIEAVATAPLRHLNARGGQLSGQRDRMDSDLLGGDFEHLAVSYKVGRVVDKRRVDFSGHVYNLQTISGDYITGATTVSNCRCDYELIIPEEDD